MLHSEIYNSDQMSLPLTERSAAYGDGVFTTAKIVDGKVEALDKHLERLSLTCAKLAIPFNDEGLSAHLIKLASAHQLAVLKMMVTAGEGGRGYSRKGCCSEKILITVHEYPSHYKAWQKNGIVLGKADTQLGINPQLAGIKHLNRLEQVLVRAELDERPEDDLLVSNCQGNVIEVSAGNVFWYDDAKQQWQTPSLTNSGVDGLKRQEILNKIPNCAIVETSIDQLIDVNAMFICNSVMGVVPVSRFIDNEMNVEIVNNAINEFNL